MAGSVEAYHRALRKYVSAAAVVGLSIFAISVWRSIWALQLQVLVFGFLFAVVLLATSFLFVSLYYLIVGILLIADRPRG